MMSLGCGKTLFINDSRYLNTLYKQKNESIKYTLYITTHRMDRVTTQKNHPKGEKTHMTQKQEAIKKLRQYFKPGAVVYTVLKHVSRSGMLRYIDVIVIRDNEPIKINHLIEHLGVFRRAKNYDANYADSLRVRGCGMDMGFHVVYTVAQVIGVDGVEFYKEITHRWI